MTAALELDPAGLVFAGSSRFLRDRLFLAESMRDILLALSLLFDVLLCAAIDLCSGVVLVGGGVSGVVAGS